MRIVAIAVAVAVTTGIMLAACSGTETGETLLNTINAQAELDEAAAVAHEAAARSTAGIIPATVATVPLGAFAAATALRTGTVMPPEVWARLSWLASGVNRRATEGAITARQLFTRIPAGVRRAGGDAVMNFLDENHVSHVQSVRNNPQQAAVLRNLVFEPRRWNLARGSADMTRLERLRLGLRSTATSLGAARAAILRRAVSGAAITGLVELPVTAVEQWLHVQNDRKTAEDALRDGMVTVGTLTLTGATAGAIVEAGAALGLTASGAVLVPIAVVGGVVYTGVAAKRIWDALAPETRASIVAQADGVVEGTRSAGTDAWERGWKLATGWGFSARRAFTLLTKEPVAANAWSIDYRRAGEWLPPRVRRIATTATLYPPPYSDPDELLKFIQEQLER